MHRLIFHDLRALHLIKDLFGEDACREALLHIIMDIEQYRSKDKKLIRY
ncbi:hypothetical protein ES703_36777 [subsurface metagenome]